MSGEPEAIAVLENGVGAIAIDSQIGVGTTITVTFPCGSEIQRRQTKIEQEVV